MSAYVVALCGLMLILSGCGAASSSGTDTPSSVPTSSSVPTTAAGSKAACTAEAILSALPTGATMEKFTYATVDKVEWAAAKVKPGPTAVFLQWNGSAWNAEDSDSVCGTASAGLPESLLAYCAETPAPSSSTSTPTAKPSPKPSPKASSSTASCTSKAILAALPDGATIEKFQCAQVGGKPWAAARVQPGPTVFFLQWTGTAWNTEDSDSVCGSASAGLPPSLLAFCKG